LKAGATAEAAKAEQKLAEAEQMFHDWKPGQCPSPTNIKYGHVYQD